MRSIVFPLVLAVAACFPAAVLLAAEKPARAARPGAKIRAVVVVGGHGYDKKAFPGLFRGHDDITVEIRPQKEKGKPGLFEDISDWPYDTIVLYNFRNRLSAAERKSFLQLLDRGVGLFVLHHAIAAYPGWEQWDKMIGCKYYLQPTETDGVKHPRSTWKHGVDIPVHVADANHPITRGMKDFTIHDETYGKWTYYPGSRVLLTTTCPINVKQLAWVKTLRKSRLFFFQLGHDNHAWTNESFRRVVAQGIRWTAGRLNDSQAGKAKRSEK